MRLSSLWSKVALSCLVLGCLFLWLLLYEVPRRQNISINLHAQTELESIAQVLALSVKSALERDDLFLLQDLQDSLWQDNTSAFAAVYLDEAGDSLLLAAYPATVDENAIDTFLARDDALAATAAFRAADSEGRVMVGLVEEANRARTIERLVPLYVSAGLLFLVAATLLVLLRRRVMTPLQEASSYAASLSIGDYAAPLHRFEGQDEVSALQRALSELSKGLQARDHDQQRLTRKLRSKVKQLEKANRKAENSLAVKQRFVANVSHEIRTPLNGILGLSNLLLHDSLTPVQRERVQKVVNSGEHLLQIIDDILDYSKVNAGKLVLQNAMLDTQRMVESIIAMVQPLAAAKQLEVIVDVQPDFPAQFEADQQRLSQILLNYLNNAIKFTKAGFVLLELSRGELSDGVPGLCFKVLDTGPGLSDEQQRQLFQEFQQVDNSLTREAGGTGLGLAISRKFAELMGGRVSVTSTPNVGSCFTVCIPLQAVVPDELSPRPLSALRALVVDDNPLTSRVVSQQLKKRFDDVVVAKCGADGMQQFMRAESQKQGFDVVLLDWLMPAMDGIAAASYMRSFVMDGRPLLIIGMTASAEQMKQALQAADNDCFDTVLSKPIYGSTLFAAIDTHLARLQGSASPAPAAELDAPAPAYAQFPGARVLLVEDNDINQEVAVGFLQKFGLTIDIANNGQEALTALAALPPDHYDVVFMDIQMPVMDGLTASRRIREQARFADLPLIAMTASANTSDRQDCLDAGMNDYLSKPIDIDLLYSKLFRYLQGARRKRVVGSPATETAAARASGDATAALQGLRGLDVKAALFLCANDQALLLRLITRLRDTWPAYVADLQLPVLEQHREVLVRVTHTLGGLFASIAAQHAGSLAQQACAALNELDWQDAAAAGPVRALLDALLEAGDSLVRQARDLPQEA